MIFFPNCKINLGLNILRRRTDGYHDLETVFYPLPLKDIIEIIPQENLLDEVVFTSSGLPIAGNEADNLCVKAWRLLKKDYPHLPSVKMHLHKNIAMGAGLGGGSADGAFMLKLLNQQFQLNLSIIQLTRYALALGSDCAFFILNKPAFARGRGEILEEVSLDLSGYTFAVVNPGIHISTSRAFSNITPGQPLKTALEIVEQPIETWQAELKNDFEAAVAADHPEIKAIKNQLLQAGAIYASMTGSGSTVFGLFNKEQIPALVFPHSYFYQLL